MSEIHTGVCGINCDICQNDCCKQTLENVKDILRSHYHKEIHEIDDCDCCLRHFTNLNDLHQEIKNLKEVKE